jgi:hypothetical protein
VRVLFNTIILFLLTSHCVLAATDYIKVGEARMKYMFWDVYDATLYTSSGAYSDDEQRVKFTLRYLRDFEAKDIVEATEEQWAHLGKPSLAKQFSNTLLSIWPDIKKGDSLTLEINNSGSATFYHNNQVVGEVNDKTFAHEFLAIWLNENTSEPELRKKLLGMK